VRLSREEKGKMPACSNNAASREVTAATIPSPNSRATTRASFGLMSEATVPQHTRDLHSRKVRTKTLSKANHLHSSTMDKAPQRAPLSSSSSTKLMLCGEAKGLSLSADSIASSAPEGFSKVLSRGAKTEALFSANPLCGDKRSRTSSYTRSKRASALDRLGPTGSDLREFLTNKQKSESFQTTSCCQQVGCQLVTLHLVHCRLGPILATSPGRRTVFDRLMVQAPMKHRKSSISRDLPSASTNMTGRGRELRKGRQASDDTPYSSLVQITAQT